MRLPDGHERNGALALLSELGNIPETPDSQRRSFEVAGKERTMIKRRISAFLICMFVAASSALAADQVVAEYSGPGSGATRPFTVDGPWEAQFTPSGKTNFFNATLMSGDGDVLGIAANMATGGHSTYYSPLPGTFYFEINTASPWQIRVVRVK
jgi:hypothetical protein